MVFSSGFVFGGFEAKTPAEPKVPTFKETCTEYFNKMHRLCIIADSNQILTTRQYFLDGGIPEDFFDSCVKAHLITVNSGKNVYFNWKTNLTHPRNTIENFLNGLK